VVAVVAVVTVVVVVVVVVVIVAKDVDVVLLHTRQSAGHVPRVTAPKSPVHMFAVAWSHSSGSSTPWQVARAQLSHSTGQTCRTCSETGALCAAGKGRHQHSSSAQTEPWLVQCH